MKMRGHRLRAGFTLIEVIITMAIFCLLAGAVFSTFSATLQSASTLQDHQNQEDQNEALGDFLKQNFAMLPGNGSFQVYVRDPNVPEAVGLIWGAGDELVAIDPQRQANGYYTLRLAAYVPPPNSFGGLTGAATQASGRFTQEVMSNDPTLNWRPLLRDLKSVTWRFRNFNDPDWSGQINGARPTLAELAFLPAASTVPVTYDFWIPSVQTAINPAPEPAAVPAANP